MFDTHATVNCLCHVINRKQADGGGGECLHFHARLAVALGSDVAMNGVFCFIDDEIGGDTSQGDGVAEWNQFTGALGGLNGGNAGDAEYVTFFGISVANQRQGFRLHGDGAGGTGDAGGFGFAADIHHMCLPGLVEMGQILVGHRELRSVTNGLKALCRGCAIIASMPFSRRLTACLLALALLAEPVWANDLPELGDVASNELSLATEKQIGQQIMHEIRWREASYLDDPDVESYLNQLGGRLASLSSDPGIGFYFFTINDRSINAFAMPGGFIGVHTGLILAAESESELAGVVAHEISHVTQRHIARQVYQSKQIGMASMLAMGLALLAARSNAQLAGAAIATTQAGAASAQLAFSRDFEREADRLGFDIMRRSGLDVRGMSLFFTRLQKATRLYENNATAYLRTHPLTVERLSDMQNREHDLPYRQVVDSIDFQLVKAKLRAMLGTPGEAIKDFNNLLTEKKYTAEAPTRFGLAFALYRARDWAGAERELTAVRRSGVSAAMLERLAAETRLAQGDPVGGLKVYRDAMVRFPMSLGLLYGYGQALIATRQFDEALRFVETQVANNPEDIRFRKMLAESHAGLGHQALQYRSMAEVFSLQGQTADAIQQLELAQKAGDANFYEMSGIDARLRELKVRRMQELKEKRK